MSARRIALRKLVPDQVRAIRAMKAAGFTRAFIAHQFGISKSALNQILAFSTYKDVR